MRLGFALQLGTVRFLGTFLDDPTAVPPSVIKTVGRQIGIADTDCLARYGEGKTRWDHAGEIRDRYGYRTLADPKTQFRLHRWLYALCWTGTDRPSVLFDRAVAWLLANTTAAQSIPGLRYLRSGSMIRR